MLLPFQIDPDPRVHGHQQALEGGRRFARLFSRLFGHRLLRCRTGSQDARQSLYERSKRSSPLGVGRGLIEAPRNVLASRFTLQSLLADPAGSEDLAWYSFAQPLVPCLRGEYVKNPR